MRMFNRGLPRDLGRRGAAMISKRPDLRTVIVGSLLIMILASGFYFRDAHPIPAQSGRSMTDSTTVDQLSRAYYGAYNAAHPVSLAGPGDPNGMLAAVLAAELLLTPINYAINLPTIVK
jgi:hypothetical protein